MYTVLTAKQASPSTPEKNLHHPQTLRELRGFWRYHRGNVCAHDRLHERKNMLCSHCSDVEEDSANTVSSHLEDAFVAQWITWYQSVSVYQLNTFPFALEQAHPFHIESLLWKPFLI